MKKRSLFFRFLLLLYLAAVCILCFMSPDSLPNVEFTLWGISPDKIVHFIMFFPFPLLAYFAFATTRRGFAGSMLAAFVLFSIGAAIAAGTELVQAFSPQRSMEAADFAADCLALGISSVLVFIINLLRKK